jgi:UDP-glucose 4-epimerase
VEPEVKVLVTGGAGYIGSHAVESLIQSGHSVVIVDNLSRGHRHLVHPQAQLIEADVRETEKMASIYRNEKVEAILHFAAFTGVSESLEKPAMYYSNNLGGTISLLKACEAYQVPYFIFSSTAAVYQDPGMELVTEQSKIKPVTPYGETKLMSEKIIQDSASSLGTKYMLLRYFNVAGASVSNRWGQEGLDATALIKRAALVAAGHLKSFSIFGTDYPTADGTAVRDFIHIEDLADLHVEALNHLSQGGHSDILNCGYGHGFSVRQVVQTMKSVSGQDFPVFEEGRRPGDLPQVVASNQKIKTLFNWTPKRDDLQLICRTAYNWEKRNLR